MDVEKAYQLIRNSYYRGIYAADGVATYTKAQALAEQYGTVLADALSDAFDTYCPSGIVTLEEALELLPRCLKMNHRELSNVILAVQNAINEDLGTGIKAIVPDFEAKRAANMAKQVAESDVHAIRDQLKKEIENISTHTVDEAQEANATFLNDAGFETLVSREYDGVGVNHGKDACEWCLARCGTDVPVHEAKEMGMFERHTGCGCTITYRTAKKTTVQTRDRVWREARNDLEQRKTIGLALDRR